MSLQTLDKSRVRAIAFDFGGTLDTPFRHWMDVYLELYTGCLGLTLCADDFRPSYVYAEQQMEAQAPVRSYHTLLETQLFKTRLQFDHLLAAGVLPDTPDTRLVFPVEAAFQATGYARRYLTEALPVLRALSSHYPLYLVSNYYGNIRTVISEFGLADCFRFITDSTLEGVRKPDPALWQCAIRSSGLEPGEFLVVGDSYKNDIFPAQSLGCQTVQGIPSDVVSASSPVIRCLSDLLPMLL